MGRSSDILLLLLLLSTTTTTDTTREGEMFYLTTHSTHFIYGYMASDIWSRTILIVRKEIRCRHICYSYRLTARVILYGPSHRQDKTYHGLCYTTRGALTGTRNSSMGPPHEGSIRRPIAPLIILLLLLLLLLILLLLLLIQLLLLQLLYYYYYYYLYYYNYYYYCCYY